MVSTLGLLIPNFNIFTFIGGFLIVLAIGSVWILKKAGLKLAFIVGMLGIAIVWVPSILEDVLRTTEGILVFWGVVITSIVLVLLFKDEVMGK